ncbi:WXG100 family type VII secretion target [Streptomyces sp. NPDC093097]|uniref:WXG100 family type VII secretion target n=1 Tax=Streptomyces sp. NPDC093097 TaxID=3366027 RepID=UPI0038067F31
MSRRSHSTPHHSPTPHNPGPSHGSGSNHPSPPPQQSHNPPPQQPHYPPQQQNPNQQHQQQQQSQQHQQNQQQNHNGQQDPNQQGQHRPDGSGGRDDSHNGGGGGGGDDAGADGDQQAPTTWLDSLKEGAKSGGQKIGEHAGDWAGKKIFGGDEEGSEGEGSGGEDGTGGEGTGADDQGPGGEGGGDPGFGRGNGGYGGEGNGGYGLDDRNTGAPLPGQPTTLPYPVPPGGPGGMYGTPGGASAGGYPGATTGLVPAGDAYGWIRKANPAPMASLPEATHPSRGGLGGMLDEAVEFALEKSGLLDVLEKVTGDLAQLNAAADAWQSQAKALQLVAEELRTSANPLSRQWEGQASGAFSGHMGDLVEAVDSTAEGMAQTAKIINSAAQECAQAEGMIIEIISEAIEALIASLAAEAVIAILTAGIGLIADALITEAEIAVFVARVARVSEQLATKLEELLKALKELGSAVKAVRNIRTAKNALGGIKKVEKAVEGVREFGEGDGALAKGVKKADEFITGKVRDGVESGVKSGLGIDDDDPVQFAGDRSGKGLGKAAGQSAWGAAKEGLMSDTNKDAIKQEILHDTGLSEDPEPYRVDRSKIDTPFG